MLQLETFHKYGKYITDPDTEPKIYKQEIMSHDLMYMQQISNQAHCK